MAGEESQGAHICWDTNCPCESCRRWQDEETVSLTDAGLEMLEELAAAAQFGETYTREELPRSFPRYARYLEQEEERREQRRVAPPEVSE